MSVGENFRFGHRAAGDPAGWPPMGGSRRGWCRWSRSRERSTPPATSAGWSWPARSRSRRASWAPRSSSAARSSQGDPARSHARLSDRQLVPDEALVCPGHGDLRRPHPGGLRGGRSACGPRSGPAGRCSSRPTARLGPGHLRQRVADRLPVPVARGAPVRLAGGADRADAARRGLGRASCAGAGPRPSSGGLLASPADGHHPGTQARADLEVRRRHRPTPARPRSRSPCSPRGSTSSTSTCASIARTTIPVAGC